MAERGVAGPSRQRLNFQADRIERVLASHRLPVRVLGAVLNDIQADGVYRYYSYLYGYTSDEENARQLAGQTVDAEVGSK